MGLLSSASFLKGVARGTLDIYDKAEETSKEGLENLKIARDEVNQELKTIGDRYDQTQTILDGVGDTSFANYLFKERGIDYISGLSTATEEARNTELSSLKQKFENLSPEDKAEYGPDGKYSNVIRDKFDSDVESAKVNSGLVVNNNMGQSTVNTLAGKIQRSVDRTFEPRRKDIIQSVRSPQLREPSPSKGAYDAISMVSATRPFTSLPYDERNTFEDDFRTWKRDNFVQISGGSEKVMQDEMDERVFIELRNAGFDNITMPNNPARMNPEEFEKTLEFLRQQSGKNTRSGIINEILKEAWFNETYPPGSYGDGILSAKRAEVAASGTPENVDLAIDLSEFEGASDDILIAELINQARDSGVDLDRETAESILINEGIIK